MRSSETPLDDALAQTTLERTAALTPRSIRTATGVASFPSVAPALARCSGGLLEVGEDAQTGPTARAAGAGL